MTLTIDLTPEQESKLQALANATGTDTQTALVDLIVALPNEEIIRRRFSTGSPADAAARHKTTAEILAGWDAEGLPSVYGRDPEDATVIARRLRQQAESREILK